MLSRDTCPEFVKVRGHNEIFIFKSFENAVFTQRNQRAIYFFDFEKTQVYRLRSVKTIA